MGCGASIQRAGSDVAAKPAQVDLGSKERKTSKQNDHSGQIAKSGSTEPNAEHGKAAPAKIDVQHNRTEPRNTSQPNQTHQNGSNSAEPKTERKATTIVIPSSEEAARKKSNFEADPLLADIQPYEIPKKQDEFNSRRKRFDEQGRSIHELPEVAPPDAPPEGGFRVIEYVLPEKVDVGTVPAIVGFGTDGDELDHHQIAYQGPEEEKIELLAKKKSNDELGEGGGVGWSETN
ncbi:hypothetical protein BJ742DRAFT_481997 [Cladochytrium replicatum]|nr:hypothetical protein BJ742DRAFT_481997 [Cladochytrium replicatum]